MILTKLDLHNDLFNEYLLKDYKKYRNYNEADLLVDYLNRGFDYHYKEVDWTDFLDQIFTITPGEEWDELGDCDKLQPFVERIELLESRIKLLKHFRNHLKYEIDDRRRNPVYRFSDMMYDIFQDECERLICTYKAIMLGWKLGKGTVLAKVPEVPQYSHSVVRKEWIWQYASELENVHDRIVIDEMLLYFSERAMFPQAEESKVVSEKSEAVINDEIAREDLAKEEVVREEVVKEEVKESPQEDAKLLDLEAQYFIVNENHSREECEKKLREILMSSNKQSIICRQLFNFEGRTWFKFHNYTAKEVAEFLKLFPNRAKMISKDSLANAKKTAAKELEQYLG